MKHWLKNIILIVVLFLTLNALFILCIPADKNNYLCAYERKMTLLDTCSQPRIIFVGGSNTAFGLDSHMLKDALHCNVVNMGLHGGIGIRYPVEDCLTHIRRGDIVVLQIEYGNFFYGGNGEPETMPLLLQSIGWHNITKLNRHQLMNVVSGLPRLALGNAKRLVSATFGGNLDTPVNMGTFHYAASGFNDLGDEVSHWYLPPQSIEKSNAMEVSVVDHDFMKWLNDIIIEYEKCGATVIMLPPVCPKNHFINCYNNSIKQALDSIGRPYVVTPQSMTTDDCYNYNGGYHINRDGVTINTTRIIHLLKTNDIIANMQNWP